mgnify:CR=1 FL=1
MKYATTDKLNDSMKAKVFKYKSDGNTVVAPYMELEPYAENVYLSLSRKNEYGNEDDDCLKTFIFPAGSIHAGSSKEKAAGRKPPPIAGTGSRIRFRARKEEPSSD